MICSWAAAETRHCLVAYTLLKGSRMLANSLSVISMTAQPVHGMSSAKSSKGSAPKDLVPFQEVLETLAKVLRLVDGQTAPPSSTAPPAVHVNLTCPKVTVQLRSSPSPSRSFSVSRMQQSRGQGSTLICQLSLHELQLAEERVSRACHSPGSAGQSPKGCPQTVVKASIGRLHLSTAAEEAAAAADVLQPKYTAPSCLATSPATGEGSLQQQVSTTIRHPHIPCFLKPECNIDTDCLPD